jgi:U32 family peptidase
MELLAPAGDLNKLKWATAYGADAVYFGTEFGSLRNFAGNFTIDDAEEGLSHLHSLGKKGYVTLNIYPWSDEYPQMISSAQALDEIGVDAIIVADFGVLSELKKLDLKAALHISTQANTTSYQAALAYAEYGAKRVNLARELSIEKIQEIQKQTNGKIETETFVHGAVCFSYSGRCAISDYLTGYGGNRGECKQPCRWKFSLVEEKRPGEFMPYFEDDRGSYFFNSKDLALFEYLPQLQEAGVASVKLEGRMKSIHYIASTVAFYRRIIDGEPVSWDNGLEELNKLPNRGYSKGFMKGSVDKEDYSTDSTYSRSASKMVGNVMEEKVDGRSVIEVRNNIFAGDKFELLSPDGTGGTITMPEPLVTIKGEQVEKVTNSQFILLEQDLLPYSILRRVPANA